MNVRKTRSSSKKHLPDDCWYLIYEKLDSKLDQISFGLTCHRFLDIQNSRCKSLKIDEYMCFTEAYSLILGKLLNRFRQLELLCLDNSVIEVSDSTLTHFENNGSKLHSLYLSFGTNITKYGLMSITNGCPLLSVISLYYCSITDSGLETLTKACKSLKEVSLEGCTKITDRGILSLNQNCRQLRALNISCCRKVVGVSFNGISSTLTCLDAEGCAMDMNATGVGRILSGGGLEYLNLSKGKIPGNGLAAIGLGFASNLKILHFYKCSFIKDDAIIEISKGCPLLQEWNLSVCFQIGIRGWESIGLYCKNLETLNVINCYICDAGLLALGNGCKRLSLLYIRKRNSAGYDDPSFFKSKLQREDVEIKGIAVRPKLPSWAFKRYI
ncbi:leucine-rich repeat domain, L domain-like protein [Tanacetum coccineum]|uniref:Leucine-rich repeat domain, L domain-like protein n=1 Tax=Tanacetum coccineum TaxID=301880 RepID=A0ABQ5A8E5_9ASTR